jgi:PII-like signaling protein
MARAADRNRAVNDGCLKLTIYFGERDRTDHGFLADDLVDIFARQELATSLVVRGTSGFGAKHQLRTDRLLTLSEDLPLVCVAVDRRDRIESALRQVEQLRFDGLVTLERARLLTGQLETVEPAPDLHAATKLTVYVGRRERAGSRPAYEAVVDLLHGRGIAGATVLLGVDGTAHGVRQRARFFGRNADVPLMIISVGDGERIAAALPELGRMLAHPLLTLERITVCKRDGQRLTEPRHLPHSDPSGLQMWQKLMVYASEQSRYDHKPLHVELIRRLREAGAAGATSLRGIWGYHGDHTAHGDSFWQLRRRAPVVTVLVDTPANIRRWFAIVDELTEQTGLVTSEIVPAHRATTPRGRGGGLHLAQPWSG